jgi:hypothetical protein
MHITDKDNIGLGQKMGKDFSNKWTPKQAGAAVSYLIKIIQIRQRRSHYIKKGKSMKRR